MHRNARKVAILALSAMPMAPAAGATWDGASSLVRDGLVGAALAIPAIKGDWRGDLQAAGSMAIAGGAAYGLKRLIPEERPDRSDRRSFPSGHSAVAFAAAATLERRYGWRAGAPALVAATFVAVARVEADKHHWHDVIAGAALGIGSGLLLTRPYDSRVRLVPWGDAQGGGLAFAMRL